MTSSRHTRRQVLEAACGRSRDLWPALVARMKDLAKASPEEAKRLDTFGKVIGARLDKPGQISKVLDGDWMELATKVLDAVVSPQTKRERLNCATCDPADFPALLAAIQVVAYGAPERMWRPRSDEWVLPAFVGLPGPGGLPPPRRDEVPESHRRIADKTWYRPQLAMLVTSLWPKDLGLEYYESTLRHILNPEAKPDELIGEILGGMVMPPVIGETPSEYGKDKSP